MPVLQIRSRRGREPGSSDGVLAGVRFLTLAAAGLVLLFALTAPAQEDRFYGVLKGQHFLQTNSSAAVANGVSNVVFQVFAPGNDEDGVTNVTLRLPNSTVLVLGPEAEDEFEEFFASTADLDTAYPNGAYTIEISTANGENFTNQLTLSGNTYPATPHFSNYSAAQMIDPTSDFTLAWDAITGATTSDFLQVEVNSCSGNDVFRTPSPGEPGAFNGTNRSVLIPARTLRPGQKYEVELLVGRFSEFDTNGIPDATGIAAYFKEVKTFLVTTGAVVECPAGEFRLIFNFKPGYFINGIQGSASYPQGIERYRADFNVSGDTNAPEQVTFTGPAGSGLSNTTNAFGGTGGGPEGEPYAYYSSPDIETPPFPPGGAYTVNYNGADLTHVLLDPLAANQQVLIVPNVITNGMGEITEIQWTYRDTNGAVIPPQSFMREVRASVYGFQGPLFPQGFGPEAEFGAMTTNAIVDPPVAWTNATSVQMSFEDVAGNEFVSYWSRFSAQVFIVTESLPSGVISNAYSQFLSAFGGNPPLIWSLVPDSGTLPTGLMLNADTGELFGTPQAEGAFNFELLVTDSTMQTDSRSFQLRIKPPGPDVTTYLVAKGRHFAQTNNNAPAAGGFQFVSFVEANAAGTVNSATLRLPGGMMRTLTEDFDRLALEEVFASQATLDAAFANGTYTFTIITTNDGTFMPSLALTNNQYPPGPHVANWAAAQMVDAASDFTLNWDTFSGGTSDDLIVLGLRGVTGEEIFSTPGFLEPNFLNGAQTSALIPSGTLAPAAAHAARLLFVKRTALNTNTYPNVPGVAAYFAETAFVITTINPAGVLKFSMENLAVDEDAGMATISVERGEGNTGTVTVEYSATGGSATTNADFTPVSGTLTFGEGVTSQMFEVPIVNDSVAEIPETIELVLSNATGGASLGDPPFATVTIVDDDAPPGPNVSFYIVAKGQGFLQTNAGAPVLEMEAPFQFGSFVHEAFPGGLSSARLRNPSGVTNALERDDGQEWNLEAGFSTKAALDAAFRSGGYSFTFNTLNEGTVSPALTLPGDAYPTTPRLANWTAAQTIDAFSDFTLSWEAFSGGGALDFIELHIDDEMSDQEIFRTAGVLEPEALNGTNTSVTIPGGTLESGKIYRGSLLFANVSSINTNAYPGVAGIPAYFKQTEFTIATASPPPAQGQIQFAEAAYNLSETGSVAMITLIRVGGSQDAVSVTVTSSNGTATNGLDFAASSVTVNFADGETNATYSFEVLDDETYEGNETIELSLSNPTGGAIIAGQTNAVATILDNEFPPTAGTLQFSAVSYNASEASDTVTITLSRTGGTTGEVSVDYATEDGSASGDSDYTPASGTLTLGAGASSTSFTIAINDDALDETNETFRVTLSNPANGASLGVRSNALVVIADNDRAGAINLTAASFSVSETGGVANVMVKRAGGTAGGVTVDYAAVAGTATEDEDYGTTTGTLEFEAGETEKTIPVPITDDALPEGNETLSLVLSNPTGAATLGAATNATLTIVDDEVVLQFSRTSFTNSEAGRVVTLTVTRTGPTREEVMVDYATGDGTALSDEDYTATNGTVTLAAGATSKTFTVPIRNDTEHEDDEMFAVTLSNPSGSALLGERDEATVTIVDNDEGGAIGFSAVNYNAKENVPSVLITVVRTGGTASDVSVDFDVTADTATEDGDYLGTNGTLTFGPGITRLTFSIPILEDALDEDNETIELSLSNPTGGATLGLRSEAMATIIDNDVAGSLRFSATSYSISETDSVATVTVLRSGGKAGAVTVDYMTEDGTATNNVDFTAATNTLTFGSNELRKTFTVPILGDSDPDGNKTVLLRLRNPGGRGKLIAPTNSVLTILDDELSVQFSLVVTNIRETLRSMKLTVVRSGPRATPFTVQYATADGTATAGGDYTTKSGTLNFGANVISQTITIPLLRDVTAEGNEMFSVALSSPAGGAQLGPNSTVVVTIVDDDEPEEN